MKLLSLFVLLYASLPALNGLDYYTAGVFEIKQTYKPWYTETENIKKNLDKYYVAAQVAEKYAVDIMVYPEQGLFPRFNGNKSPYGNKTWALHYAEDVPDPRRELKNPCSQPQEFKNHPILRNLSCLAKVHNFYVVADLIDVKNCEVRPMCDKYNIDYCRTDPKDCPEDGKLKFDTVVAFNRQGVLVDRHYKKQSYLDPNTDADSMYFETEFGKFTMDVGLDLVYSDSVRATENFDITGLVFSTWWYDMTPFFYLSTPYQQAWSMTNKVNLLAANVHDPRMGTLGSGIYSAIKGALLYTHNPDGRSKLLISKVPKSTEHIPEDFSDDKKFFYIDDDESINELKGEEPRNFESECGKNVLGNSSKEITDYRCHQTEVQTYTFAKLVETEGYISICSNGFCCSLNYTAESMNETFYFGVSGNPLDVHHKFLLGVQSCFLARCESVNGEDCRNYKLKSSTIFKNVRIQGTFDTKHIYPTAINSDIRLTDKDEWQFDKSSTMVYQNLRGNPLLFLSLFGRMYDKDHEIENKMQK